MTRSRRIYLGAAIVLYGGFQLYRGTVGVTAAETDFARRIADVTANGERPSILEHSQALKPCSDREVESLLYQGNRYLQALAIGELRERRNRNAHRQVLKMYLEGPFDLRAARFDPHAVPAPENAVLLASAEYLAAMDKGSTAEIVLSRKEIFAAPHLFTAALREVGPGWIRVARRNATEPRQQSALGYLIVSSSTRENLAELNEILRFDKSSMWEAAARACERLDDETCWEGIEESISGLDASLQLLGRMSEFRRGKTTVAKLWAAAERLAVDCESMSPSDARTVLLLDLLECLNLAQQFRIPVPDSASDAIRRTGSTDLQIAMAAVKAHAPVN